jgi:hypothetical protein
MMIRDFGDAVRVRLDAMLETRVGVFATVVAAAALVAVVALLVLNSASEDKPSPIATQASSPSEPLAPPVREPTQGPRPQQHRDHGAPRAEDRIGQEPTKAADGRATGSQADAASDGDGSQPQNTQGEGEPSGGSATKPTDPPAPSEPKPKPDDPVDHALESNPPPSDPPSD